MNKALAKEALAPAAAPPSGAPSEDEFQAFSAALSASARGRAFLAEYGRRNRGADTETLLAALARLEAQVRRQAQAGAEPARAGLRALLLAIRAAQPEIDASALPARAAKLAQLLALLERRIEALVEPAAPPAGEAGLAVVPPPEQPELPIPSPTAAQQPTLTLAHDRGLPPARPRANASAAAIPEVAWLDVAPPPPPPQPVRTAFPPPPPPEPKAAAIAPAPVTEVRKATPPEAKPPEAKPPEDVWALSTAKIAPPPPDPLALLMLLSEEERLALFT